MQKTLKQYAEELHLSKGIPGKMADLQVELSAHFSTLTEEYIDLKIAQADFWKRKEVDDDGVIREKPLSDKSLEMKWLLTDDGKRYLKVKYGIRAITVMLRAISSGLFNANTESRSQY